MSSWYKQRLPGRTTAPGVIGCVQRDEFEQLSVILEANTSYGHDDLARALHIAADLGTAECTALLLKHGARPDIHDPSGFTPVVIAARKGHADIVKQLISAGCNVNKPTFRVRACALHWASTNGHYKAAQELLLAGANMETRTVHQRTPLMLAARSDHPAIVELLLESGVDLNAVDTAGASALHLATEEGSVDCVALLVQAGADVNGQMRRGDTPVMNAARKCFPETMRVLIATETVDLTKMSRELNLLHWAAVGGNADCIEQLLNLGMDPNKRTAKSYCKLDFIVAPGVTPLMLASKGGHAAAVELLLRSGAIVDLWDDEGMSGLLYATRGNHGECIEVLVKGGADPNGKMREVTEDETLHLGMSPLLMAAERANLSAVLSLLRMNADVNLIGFGHWHQDGAHSAFEVALIQKHFNACKMMIVAGFNIRSVSPTLLQKTYEVLLTSDDEENLPWFMEVLQNPLSLNQVCRASIRKCVQPLNISQLPLPSALMEYLQLNDLKKFLGETENEQMEDQDDWNLE
eukprot:GHVO01024482.1.p1 GENE.GHVO01024482.1~~GHVO01024482.1.p1  ORF type:complete len:522 (+),score=49.83 GHVO01024482.1:117-1682(+)